MKTRNQIINLIEEDEDNSNKYYSNNKKNYIDTDEYYEIEEEDDPDYDDTSYFLKRGLKENYKRKENYNISSKKIQSKTTTNSKNYMSQNKKFLRKSFKNSLGGKSSKKNEDNKEKIKDYFLKSSFRKYANQFTESKKKFPYKENSQKIFDNNNINNQVNEVNKIYLDKEYFYQDLTYYEWKEISKFISSSLSNKNLEQKDIESFFSRFPNLIKGENNIIKLRKILEDSTKNSGGIFSFFTKKTIEFDSYQKLNDFIINRYYMVKPSIFEVHFFPNPSEEIHLINLITKTKVSLDIAMFTINNVRIAEEIKNIYLRGIKIRIISDCQFMKLPSSNIYSLASIGINIKVDDSVRYYMHHKFCVIDQSVVITGSFNWTEQAVKHNQENLLFLENKNLAIKYSNEFQRLWDDFETVVTKEKAIEKIKENEENKRIIENRKKREKEKKLKEKEIKENQIKYEIFNDKNKNFTKKKRNRNEIQNNNTYNIMYNDENNNNKNTNENKSSCNIF